MNTSENLQTVAERLFRENICPVPLNEKELQKVAEFMRLRNANSELMRRLSTVELNYEKIREDAEEAINEAYSAKAAILNSFKSLIDVWAKKGYNREFMFTFKEEDGESMKSDLSVTLESININLNILSKSLMTLGETSAQMRACSASFLEIYHESKLAIYAGMLNRNQEEILDCRAISLQAHASANESSRSSSLYLGKAQSCTKIISLINELISESSYSMFLSYGTKSLSPAVLTQKISDVIQKLEYISLENN
jgi:hypothetical protein